MSCAHNPINTEKLTLTAVADVVPPPVGCGTLFIGTPVTFRVVSGPRALKGKNIQAIIPCLDFYKDFYVVGRTYELQLTRQNVYKIEIQMLQTGAVGNTPDHISDPLYFYLRSATDLETGQTNTWDTSTRRGY